MSWEGTNNLIRDVYRPSFEWLCRDHPHKEEFLKQWDEGTIDIDAVMNELEAYGWQKVKEMVTEVNKEGYVTFKIHRTSGE